MGRRPASSDGTGIALLVLGLVAAAFWVYLAVAGAVLLVAWLARVAYRASAANSVPPKLITASPPHAAPPPQEQYHQFCRLIGRLVSECVGRRVVWRSAPYDGRGSVGAPSIDAASIAPWASPSDLLARSRHLISCTKCMGQGKVTCETCGGAARVDGAQAPWAEVAADARIIVQLHRNGYVEADDLRDVPADWAEANWPALQARLQQGERVRAHAFALLEIPSIDEAGGSRGAEESAGASRRGTAKGCEGLAAASGGASVQPATML